MKPFFAFDTEDDGNGNAYLFNFFDPITVQHHTFVSQDKAVRFVLRHRDHDFWAVNAAYDVNNLFRDYFHNLEITYAGSKFISAKIVKSKIRIFDTLNHWKLSVKKMGEKIGLEKMEFPHEPGYIPTGKALKKAIEYCKRDTEIAAKFTMTMLELYEREDVPIKGTVASSTLGYFQNVYYGDVTHRFEEEMIDWMHEGYYGGRTEIFFNRPVRGNIFYIDVNSLYPSVMHDFEYPSLDHYYWVDQTDFSKEGMTDVEIECPKTIPYPYLPYRKKKLVYPTGRWRAKYTNFQIREAIKLGYIVHKVYDSIEFSNNERPFTDYIAHLYAERKKLKDEKGDPFLIEMYKDLMNHCYGKFAQGNTITKLYHIDNIEPEDGDQILDGQFILRNEIKDYPRHANCIWSAYITAYGHHRLYMDGIMKVHEAGGKNLYCDTDGLFYQAKKQLIPTNNDLGKFKFEKKYDWAYFKGLKMYKLIEYTKNNSGKITDKLETIKSKGVPKSVTIDYFSGKKVLYRKPMKLRETIRRNSSKLKQNVFKPNQWVETSKELSGKYDKRIVLKTGTTIPLHINEGE